ncbi:MAG: polyprenyl synthetase family protein [Gammaproteobacteria bacterium]
MQHIYQSQFYEFVVSEIDKHFKALFTQLKQNSAATTLIHAMEYSCLQAGKRLRPLLVYGTGQLFHLNNLAVLDPCAIAIELIHIYSLIHDDLPAMDNDDFRRGQPTCHKVFNEATAILAGDALLTLAFETIAKASKIPPEQKLNIIHILSHTVGPLGLLAGQELDLHPTENSSTPQIHALKTGLLFQAAVKIALEALSPTSFSRSKEKVLEFVHYFGLAYQLYDDLEDALQDQQTENLKQIQLNCKSQFEQAKECLEQIPGHANCELYHLSTYFLNKINIF